MPTRWNTGFSPSVRGIVLERCAGLCEVCGRQRMAQIHHRRPRGAGGSKAADTNRASNALAVCSDCHSWIEHNRIKALSNGWLVRQGHSPRMTPVLYGGAGGWVFLADDGGLQWGGDAA